MFKYVKSTLVLGAALPPLNIWFITYPKPSRWVGSANPMDPPKPPCPKVWVPSRPGDVLSRSW